MAKVVHCDCGYVARGESDEELIQVVQEHAKETHDMDLSREQILSMAKPE
jgi:predicted small metal-binding protein